MVLTATRMSCSLANARPRDVVGRGDLGDALGEIKGRLRLTEASVARRVLAAGAARGVQLAVRVGLAAAHVCVAEAGILPPPGVSTSAEILPSSEASSADQAATRPARVVGPEIRRRCPESASHRAFGLITILTSAPAARRDKLVQIAALRVPLASVPNIWQPAWRGSRHQRPHAVGENGPQGGAQQSHHQTQRRQHTSPPPPTHLATATTSADAPPIISRLATELTSSQSAANVCTGHRGRRVLYTMLALLDLPVQGSRLDPISRAALSRAASCASRRHEPGNRICCLGCGRSNTLNRSTARDHQNLASL